MHASHDIRFELNYSGSQFWFLQWLSLANPVLPTEIIICRFADELGGVPPPPTHPCSATPVYIGKREGSFIQDKEIGILYTFIMRTPIPGTVKETKVPQ
jgi:hypothetical protein